MIIWCWLSYDHVMILWQSFDDHSMVIIDQLLICYWSWNKQTNNMWWRIETASSFIWLILEMPSCCHTTSLTYNFSEEVVLHVEILRTDTPMPDKNSCSFTWIIHLRFSTYSTTSLEGSKPYHPFISHVIETILQYQFWWSSTEHLREIWQSLVW